jgi:hypothetical protein
MHLDDGQVQRLADAELALADASVRDHVAGCAQCRARVAEATEENAWLIARVRELDHPPPAPPAVATTTRGGGEPIPDTAPSPRVPESRGVSLTPGDRLTIDFSAEQPGSAVTVILIEGTDVAVRAVDGIATFTSAPDALAIDNAGSAARFEIEIPRSARHVEIRVVGGRVFAKDSSVVTSGRPEANDRYVIRLVRPAR